MLIKKFISSSLLYLALPNLCIGLCFLMGGCSSSPKSLPLSKLTILFQSTPNLNPDINGRPSPVDIRIYQLKQTSTFSQSKFFDLYNHSQSVLGRDLVEEHSFEVRPRRNKKIDINLEKEAKYLGFLVAYYDINQAKWKDVLVVSELERDTMTLSLNSKKFSIT